MVIPRLPVERYADEVASQATLFADHLTGADLATPVPSCPGWNLAQLTQHTDEGFRWIEGMVRTRASEPAADTAMRVLDPAPAVTAEERGASLAAAGQALAETLREAGADTPMWTPLPDRRSGFFARRFAHEAFMHRADGALALGLDVTIAEDLALDGLAEWMELGGLPQMLDFHPARRELLGPGRTIRVEATDTDAADGAWLVDLTGDVMIHRHAQDETAAATLRAPLATLLLVLYARRPLDADGTTLDGDTDLLRTWWERSAFG
ncbi:maleylpyruvate isomerase N-terminal domain-containing protein [Actinomycetospora sp. NBC_00405]|uniref:maleylpyruvate isomerase N-terminal domain-containing protein n=1 Tax=Actinomycetospora sp. NBC_00405 TaxID=2975952 RepID=UPI002E234E68